MLLKNDAASNDVTSHWADVARSSFAVRLEKTDDMLSFVGGFTGGVNKTRAGQGRQAHSRALDILNAGKSNG